MNLALVYDELLTDPQYAGIMAEFASMMPTAYADQLAAAADHGNTLRDHIGDAIGIDPSRTGYMPVGRFPDWLRLGAFDALASWITGKADTCRHSPHPSRPQPVVAAAWKPGLVVCGQCTRLTGCTPGSLADRTCDACGHECTGPEHGDGIWPGMIQAGLLLYEFGVCESCKDSVPNPNAV